MRTMDLAGERRQLLQPSNTLVKTAELDPSRNYLAGFHPHGIGVIGAFTNLCMEVMGFSSVFPGICSHLMMLNMWFCFPFFRDYIMSMGLVSADKESAAHILSRKGGGNLLSIIVGGIQEALTARPGAYKLVLQNRKGFIRLALIHGAALVPIFSFGENDIFDQVENSPGSWLHWFQDRLLKTTRFSIPLFYGHGVFQYSVGFMPYRWPITTADGGSDGPENGMLPIPPSPVSSNLPPLPCFVGDKEEAMCRHRADQPEKEHEE
ncbi:hypothetical protein MJT46_010264 [Ovis ammon polii x Ovis aries]|nr:hypothetical protein MJT46_010264 [Ovis ammon polii x Ovis aries]